MRGVRSPWSWALVATLAVSVAEAQVIELDDEPPARKAPAKKAAAKAPPVAPAPKKKPKAEPAPEGPKRGIPAREVFAPPASPVKPAVPPQAAPTSTPAAAGDDDSEVFDSGDAPSAPPRSVPTASANEEERFEITGWVRTRASLYGEDDRRAPADPLLTAVTRDPEGQTLPYDRATGDVQGYLRARYRKGRRFEAVVAASAAWSAYGNASPSASAFAGASESQPRTVFEAVVREGWVGVYRDRFDLRVGLQRIAWGRSDAITPNDVVNARDVRDPFVTETALQRLPTLAVRADLALGASASVQLHVAPFFQADSFDLWGSNGAFVQPTAPASLRYLLNRVGKLADPTLRAEMLSILGQSQKPRLDFTEPSAGARLGWEAGGFDGAFYGHYGFHTQPYFRVSPDLNTALAQVDLSTAGGLAKPFLDSIERGAPLVLSTYIRRLHAGFDVARAVGPVVLKIEGAYDSRAPVLRDDFTSPLVPVATGVFGLEWQPGDGDTFVLLETSAQQLLELPAGRPLLFVSETTLSQGALVRHTFREHLELELRGAAVIDPQSFVLRPQIAWKEPSWEVRAGLVWLEGDDNSYARYYARNAQAFLVGRGKF